MTQTTIKTFPKKIVIAMSASALFDMRIPHRIFLQEGEQAFERHMGKNIDRPLPLGSAATYAQQMLALNQYGVHVSIAVVSRMNPFGRLRVHASIEAYEGLHTMLNSAGDSPGDVYMKGTFDPAYLEAMHADLFLTTNPADAKAALAHGIAAAVVSTASLAKRPDNFDQKRLESVFDLDRAVIIAKGEKDDRYHDSEHFFTETLAKTQDLSESLKTYRAREICLGRHPVDPGPLAAFYLTMCAVRDHVRSLQLADAPTVANTINTMREKGAATRPLRTLHRWQAEPDAFAACGKTPKATYLQSATIFFDDGLKHIQAAPKHVLTAHVPWDEETRHQSFKKIFPKQLKLYRGWKAASAEATETASPSAAPQQTASNNLQKLQKT